MKSVSRLLKTNNVVLLRLPRFTSRECAFTTARHFCSAASSSFNNSTVADILQHSKSEGRAIRHVLEDEKALEAMRAMIKLGCSTLVVRDSEDRIVGFLTQRDLIRCVVRKGVTFTKDEEPRGWNVPVGEVMTASKDLVYLSPKDTLEEARALMSISGKRNIPVLSGNALLGIISPKDIARALHTYLHVDDHHSAKEQYVSTVMPRKGMPIGARLASLDADNGDTTTATSYTLRSAVCNLAHPHKGTDGEDAFLLGPHMIGVADGVGSWWEHDVDPATYARGIMASALQSCLRLNSDSRDALRRPQRVLQEAWHQMQASTVCGSSTACLVAPHPRKAELLAANVGDSGFLLIRRVAAAANQNDTSRVRGTLDASGERRGSGAGETTMHSHYIAFRSPQQLKSFNAPFQLGRAPGVPLSERDERFETPHDASLVRVPIQVGDIIVLATDGLFDNMPECTVLDVLAEFADAPEAALASTLAERAQELSLDASVDSPFAILAKDNDILWGGGRPDDITVIVSTVVDKHVSEDAPAVTGPGEPPKELEAAAELLSTNAAAAAAAAASANVEVESLPEW